MSTIKRLEELEKTLKRHGLLKDRRIGWESPQEQGKAHELFVLRKRGHLLRVCGFSDGTLAVGFVTADEEPTYVTLLAAKGKEWSVSVASNFPDRCSAVLMDLWSAMPERRNVDRGTFTVKNAAAALNLFARDFSKLPDAA